MRRFLVGCLSILGVLFLLLASGIGYLAWRGFSSFQEASAPELPSHMLLTLSIEGQPSASSSNSPFKAFTGDSLSLRDIVSRIDGAAKDGRVQGLFVDFSNAQLSPAAAQDIAAAVQRFKAKRKPTYAFADTMGEAGGATFTYALAAQFDRVWLQPAGALGIDGLALERPYLSDALKSIGVAPRLDQRHEFKGGIDMFTEMGLSAALRGSLQKLTDDLLAQAVEMIAKGRNISADDAKAAIDTAPIAAQDAVTQSLIDQMGYRSDALRALKDTSRTQATVSLTDYRVPDTLPNAALHVAVIEAAGPVVRGGEGDDPFAEDGSFAAGRVVAAFTAAVQDPTVKGILFRIDSPGGSYVASDTIWQAVRAAQDAGKPVVAVMGSYAASGGYFVAAPADKIVAQPGTLTGSIGVYSGKFLLTGLWDKLGIRWERVASGASAGQNSPNRDFTPAEWARFQENLDRIYADFTQRVAAGRKIPMEKMDALARGRIWSGASAKEAGLVDRLGGMTEATEEMRALLRQPVDAPLRLVNYPAAQNSFDKALKFVSKLEQTATRIEGVRTRLEPLLTGESLYMPLDVNP
jgi:protease IV